jgi:RNA polymerase sigma-70 factor (ECF subfamily)
MVPVKGACIHVGILDQTTLGPAERLNCARVASVQNTRTIWVGKRISVDFAPIYGTVTKVTPSEGLHLESQERIDWELMQRVAADEEAAIEELYARFGALVFQSARQVLRSRAETEDAVQEVFVRLWQTADRFDPQRAKLVTWVMLITRRHLIDRLRRQSARPERTLADDSRLDAAAGPEPSKDRLAAGEESSESRDRLRRQLQRLPELQRTVIERAYLQGFSLREIAVQLDAPLGTVKSALSRGLAKLRELEGGGENRG